MIYDRHIWRRKRIAISSPRHERGEVTFDLCVSFSYLTFSSIHPHIDTTVEPSYKDVLRTINYLRVTQVFTLKPLFTRKERPMKSNC
jgi:hypothetical protein